MRLAHRLAATLRRAHCRIDRPVPALPLDLFRIGAGVLCAAYVWHLRRDIPTYSAPSGVIDHRLVRRMFPYTRISLFPERMSERALTAVHTVALVASAGVVLGVRVRLSALVLYLVAVSTSRRNFIASYVDDAIVHLVLFWLLLLPTGTTLAVGASADWRRATVPGFATRMFTANLAMIYLVAGLWKWNSPLWRQGLALYATLKMPISRAPEFWQPSAQPVLRPASHFSLLIEPALATLPLLPTHSRVKYALGGSLLALHGGIIATLKIPYANAACIATLPLLFRDELMDGIAPRTPPAAPTPASTPAWVTALASACVGLLALQNVWRIRERTPAGTAARPRVERWRRRLGLAPELPHHHNPWSAPLYLMGLAQSYRLLDWVDVRNWHQVYDGEEETPEGVRPFDTTRLFPAPMRSVLLHSYIQDQCWMAPPAADLPELQHSLLTRHVARFARRVPNTGEITVHINRSRITQENLDLRIRERHKLLQFRIQDGTPIIRFMRLTRAEA